MPRFDGRWFPSSNTSDWAAGKFGTPGWYPAAPTGVTPTEGDQQVALSWDAGNTHGSDITGYKVEKNDGSSWSTATSDTGSDATSYTATGLTNGTGYTFRVTAINSVGLGETVSSASAASTPRGVPGAPGTLSLAEGDPAHTVIDLSWSAGSTNGSAITGYKIQRSTDGSSWSTLVADTGSTGTTYSSTGLTAETTYHYRVASINVAGTGGYGNEPNRETGLGIMTYSTTGSPTLRTYGIYTSLTWTGSGSFQILGNPQSLTFDYMIVAGGGSGGSTNNNLGGGGGGGGVRVLTGQSLSTAAHTVTIGAGGTAAWNTTHSGSGGNTSLGAVETTGGGGGGNMNWAMTTPQAGGAGGAGGAGATATNSMSVGLYGGGNAGSYSPSEGTRGGMGSGDQYYWVNNQGAGGGGGGVTVGSNNTAAPPGWPSAYHGSAGQTNNYMTGATITAPYTGGVTAFAGGGGGNRVSGNNYPGWGGIHHSGGTLSSSGLVQGGVGRCGAGNSSYGTSTAPGAGVANSGGGGGGRCPTTNNSAYLGGNGGSGVVVIRWVTE